MVLKDTVLSIELGPNDCLYRILREDEAHSNNNNNITISTTTKNKKIVYVVLKHPDLIPKASRTKGPDVIRAFSNLKEWPSHSWHTLTVFGDGGEKPGVMREEADEFRPHALSQRQLLGNYEYFDILELHVVQSVKERSFRVVRQEGVDGSTTTTTCFLKIARFAFELGWLAQEIEAHHTLAHRDAFLAPRILGYAYEETPDRVIGLLFEEVKGRRPTPADLPACQAALQKLHDLDVVHGDIVMDNIFITDDGVKFIDFEESCIGPIGEEDEWRQRKEDEMQSLIEQLSYEPGKRRP
ncbi:hypothetical protein PT974_02514 [Cladobotryum mycophilum]|uniref:Non-specific serine/threonine protein kinase n=1 Tax=Cladobotryum mycophilum TaxID=491253 RepID=A0ABR0SZJ7_9HYPO